MTGTAIESFVKSTWGYHDVDNEFYVKYRSQNTLPLYAWLRAGKEENSKRIMWRQASGFLVHKKSNNCKPLQLFMDNVSGTQSPFTVTVTVNSFH